MGKVADPPGSFWSNIVVKSLAHSLNSAFGLAICLVVVCCSHVEVNINVQVGHNCIQKCDVNLESLSDTIEVGKP